MKDVDKSMWQQCDYWGQAADFGVPFYPPFGARFNKKKVNRDQWENLNCCISPYLSKAALCTSSLVMSFENAVIF